jgi:response regulator RpfG family c-di-GMP phosphodiesterase
MTAPELNDLQMASLLHHLGQVMLDDPNESQKDVATVTGAMLREIRPLAGAGDIVAGDPEDPRRKLAAQILRLASQYDDLTVRDHVAGELALETLRSAPGYVYEPRVVTSLERVLAHRLNVG